MVCAPNLKIKEILSLKGYGKRALFYHEEQTVKAICLLVLCRTLLFVLWVTPAHVSH